MAHRREQLQGLAITAPAAAQDLPVDGQTLQYGYLPCHHPLAHQLVEVHRIDLVEYPEKRGITWGQVFFGFGGIAAAQRPKLSLAKLPGYIFKGLIAPGAHEHGHRRTSQHKSLAMTQAVPAALVAEGFEQIQQRAQCLGP